MVSLWCDGLQSVSLFGLIPRRVPVDANCAVTESCGLTARCLPAGLSRCPSPAHRELAGPAAHHTPCPSPPTLTLALSLILPGGLCMKNYFQQA